MQVEHRERCAAAENELPPDRARRDLHERALGDALGPRLAPQTRLT